MSNSDLRTSLSVGEQQRSKSRSSSRSHRTPPNITVHEEEEEYVHYQDKPPSQLSRRSTRDANLTKRSESSMSNRSVTAASPSLNISKKPRGSLKSSSPPTNRRRNSKRKKSLIIVNELEKEQVADTNNSEKQDLSVRGLSLVPPDIFDIITLRKLILSNNNLSGIPSLIGLLINLEYLDVSHNPLIVKNGHDDYSCFPQDFVNLRNLQTLIMTDCGLKYIPVAVWSLTSLQILNISRNKVGYLVSEIGNLTDIRHLRLSHMDLDTLPPEIGFCTKIETIDLTGNPIDSIPETLIECRQLYELKLNYKTFYKILDNYMLQLIDDGKIRSEHIPQVIFELESLQTLDLSQTKINSIPMENTLLNLTELYLSNNSFFDIPEAICTIEQLKYLDMSSNRLRNIPNYFNKMKQLEILNLSYNQLSLLPKIFSQLSSLKQLIVHHNKIDRIDKQFSQSQSILIIDLSYNLLTNFSNEFCELKQLETLDLRYNKIASLPSTIRRMIGLKSMNTFDNKFQRTGLHVLGNPIIEPPSYIWKSTDIQTLFNYIETKEKNLSTYYYHLKLIFLGPKNVGKTSLIINFFNNRKMLANTRKPIDMCVAMLQEKPLTYDEEDKQRKRKMSNATSSSIFTEQWIENRISTSGDYTSNRHSKIVRANPPPLNTYHSNEKLNHVVHKSTIITKNNICLTMLDLVNESSFEILYPLIYDSNALYILPVNLTILLNILQAANSLENIDQNEKSSKANDFDALLTEDWLNSHIFHYIESISDHCQEVFIAILGLMDKSQLLVHNQQELAQQLLDEIHSKMDDYLINKPTQYENLNRYSEFFPEPIDLTDEQMSTQVLEQFEVIAQQWNMIHHKQKRYFIKNRLGFNNQERLLIDYNTCLKYFEQQEQISLEHEEDIGENREIFEKELNHMSFDEHIEYLKLIGDIFSFGRKPNEILLLKPYVLLNDILSKTIFRPKLDQWLNYDENLIFRFSGYYPIQKTFEIDRQRLLNRGEFTWNMLHVLFHEQNNDNISLTDKNLLDYCRLMERLYLGYVNETNLTYKEFTTMYFVCPWLMKENCTDFDYIDYFKRLEQERQYETHRRERTRRIKQQQIWFSFDNDQESLTNETSLEINETFPIVIPELPFKDEIEIFDSQIINQESIIQTIQIHDEQSNLLPNGFYERLLICLHPLFHERLDYYNLTIGRTIDRSLIKIERSDEENEINITMNKNLLERIENLLSSNLFLLYPNIILRIET